LDLGASRRGVGKDKASAEAESKAGGFEGVAARRDVVHEIGLAERQHLAIAGEVVLLGWYRAKRQLVAGALGLHGLRAADGFDNLSAGAMVGDVMGKAGVGVGIAGAVGDRYQPAGAGNKSGHFAGGGVEVEGMAGGGFDGVGKAAGLVLLQGKRAVALAGVSAGSKYVHGVWPVALRQRRKERAVWVSLRQAKSRLWLGPGRLYRGVRTSRPA